MLFSRIETVQVKVIVIVVKRVLIKSFLRIIHYCHCLTVTSFIDHFITSDRLERDTDNLIHNYRVSQKTIVLSSANIPTWDTLYKILTIIIGGCKLTGS